MDDSAIIYTEVIVVDVDAKLNPKDNDETKLFEFLLITIALLIAVSIYCYLIKYCAKQKRLLPFYEKQLKQAYNNNIN